MRDVLDDADDDDDDAVLFFFFLLFFLQVLPFFPFDFLSRDCERDRDRFLPRSSELSLDSNKLVITSSCSSDSMSSVHTRNCKMSWDARRWNQVDVMSSIGIRPTMDGWPQKGSGMVYASKWVNLTHVTQVE